MNKMLLGTWLFLMIYTSSLLANPLSAFVESDEIGQAILLNRLGVCYAISPTHVVHEGYYASLVGAASTAPKGEADEGVSFGYDLTLMRAQGGIEKHCNESYKKPPNHNDIVSNATTGHILTADSLGNMTRQHVSIINTGLLYLYVEPIDQKQPFMKGMSGSLLEIKGKPAGMLMSVDAETGNGKVLRYDRLMETIAPFFGASVDMPVQQTGKANANKKPKTNSLNLAKEILSWSVASLDSSSRANNLLNQAPNAVWYGKLGKFPVDIEVLLSKEKSVVLSEVELIIGKLEPVNRAPRDIEILVSSQKNNRWMPIISSTVFKSDSSKVLSFSPVRAKKIKVRIYSNWGDPIATGLHGVNAR
ncbi:hypothetical protein [uncultured Cycloclasticus sp.]|uniref:hypothetical protein n=1 Tax=uncultured Cycloclasticus sp. TaxID=172194 RepID=UPI00258F5741|nr:hypothetical protein [uncultured Cycloclasticus sp.]